MRARKRSDVIAGAGEQLNWTADCIHRNASSTAMRLERHLDTQLERQRGGYCRRCVGRNGLQVGRAPVQMLVTRREFLSAARRNLQSTSDEGSRVIAPATTTVSNFGEAKTAASQRLRRTNWSQAHKPTGLRQHIDAAKLFASVAICEFEDREGGQVEDLDPGKWSDGCLATYRPETTRPRTRITRTGPPVRRARRVTCQR